jgi:hypothetical protein
MHTFRAKTCFIHHNGDFSGDAIIVLEDGTQQLELPIEDLLAFAAEAVRTKKIGDLESATTEELLGL